MNKDRPIREFQLQKYSEQLPMIPDADCLGFDKESIHSDLCFDKESYRAHEGSRLRSTIESFPLFAISKKVPFFIKSALSSQY